MTPPQKSCTWHHSSVRDEATWYMSEDRQKDMERNINQYIYSCILCHILCRYSCTDISRMSTVSTSWAQLYKSTLFSLKSDWKSYLNITRKVVGLFTSSSLIQTLKNARTAKHQNCYSAFPAIRHWHIRMLHTNLRCIAVPFNSVLRTAAALSTPVEMKLFQPVGVVKRASLDHCRGWPTINTN